jgi:hypothetical protein
MNGVQTTAIRCGWPATTVLRLAGDRPLKTSGLQRIATDELLLASVLHPPRSGQTQPIAALMPQVLAQYGLADASSAGNTSENAVDLLA